MGLSHIDERGAARMVDVTEKLATAREAVAAGEVWMRPETLALIQAGGMPKGDVLAVARVAGMMAAKRTPELIPLCHPLPITAMEVDFSFDEERSVVGIVAQVRCTGVTGVEMEALTAASVAALTLYDMIKAVDKLAEIDRVKVLAKSGGKSGDWARADGGTA